jgi:hypothetical protein
VHAPLKSSVLLAAIVVLLLAACATPSPTPTPTGTPTAVLEGFAIYLPAQPLTSGEILTADLSRLRLQAEPVLAMGDIVSYSKDAHEIELTSSAQERIAQMQVPVSGMPFVVCVDRRPIYGGAFWVSFSSLSFDGVVIDTLFAAMGQNIHIQLGYPESPERFVGEDPRSDPRILQALAQAGKLK